jgi:diguanylate cyclase (GGDEF)-like protein/PAS domain S-box-containing protein
MSATSCALIVTDFTRPDNPISFVNSAFTILTGYTSEEAIGRNCRFLQGAGTDPAVAAEIRESLAAGRSIRREILNYRKDGEPFWNDLMIDPVRDDDGVITGFVGVQYRTTVGQAARAAQVEAEAHLESIVGNLPGYVFRRILKPDGMIAAPYFGTLVNGILGIAEGEVATPEQFYRRVHPDDKDRLMDEIKRSAANLSPFEVEFRLISSEGVVHWFRSMAPVRRVANGDVIWDGFALEITAEKAAETQLAFLAFHDSLTGLSNRTRFKNSLRKAIDTIPPDEGRIGIFIIDLDEFQEVNTIFGQATGDEVLRIVGQRLKSFAEDFDGTVARLAGDEFAVLLPSISPKQTVGDIADAIRCDLVRPMDIVETQVSIQACIGSAIFPRTRDVGQPLAVDASVELMQQADLALQAAKQTGPGTHRGYAPEFDDRARNRMVLRQSLSIAIAEEQFELHYQPLVDLRSGRVVAAEALVRWNHTELGLQRPDLFIPLAESSGLIVPLGAWIMKDAMRQSRAWRQAGLDTPRIGINVSSVQLQKPGFLITVEQALSETGADPVNFEFELTEGLLIEASPEILSILDKLKSFGFSIAIDDFGTGHSTFKYLRDFPVDKIKIDQTFIRKLVIDSSDASIVRAMIALAHNLGVEIVAEGIETTIQRDFLRDEGCEIGQGYLFSMPLAAEDFGWMLQSHVTLPMSAKYPPIH